jgi:hypothetical protein
VVGVERTAMNTKQVATGYMHCAVLCCAVRRIHVVSKENRSHRCIQYLPLEILMGSKIRNSSFVLQSTG